MTNPTPKPRKEPYTGDPNATLTICYEKRRRHLARDLMYVPLPVENEVAEDGKIPDTVPPLNIMVICRHCKQDPVIYRDEEKQPA